MAEQGDASRFVANMILGRRNLFFESPSLGMAVVMFAKTFVVKFGPGLERSGFFFALAPALGAPPNQLDRQEVQISLLNFTLTSGQK